MDYSRCTSRRFSSPRTENGSGDEIFLQEQRSKGSFGISLETSFASQREIFRLRFVVKVVAVVVVREVEGVE